MLCFQTCRAAQRDAMERKQEKAEQRCDGYLCTNFTYHNLFFFILVYLFFFVLDIVIFFYDFLFFNHSQVFSLDLTSVYISSCFHFVYCEYLSFT